MRNLSFEDKLNAIFEMQPLVAGKPTMAGKPQPTAGAGAPPLKNDVMSKITAKLGIGGGPQGEVGEKQPAGTQPGQADFKQYHQGIDQAIDSLKKKGQQIDQIDDLMGGLDNLEDPLAI